jgi:hypothetical protein
MNQTVRIKRVRIRVPGGAQLAGANLANRVANSIATQSRQPVPEPIQRKLAAQLTHAVQNREKR